MTLCSIKTLQNTSGYNAGIDILKTYLTDQKIHTMTKLKMLSLTNKPEYSRHPTPPKATLAKTGQFKTWKAFLAYSTPDTNSFQHLGVHV